MPATEAALNEEEINDGESCARSSRVAWRDDEGRSEGLDEVASLGMGLKTKKADDFAGSRMHE